MYGTPAAINRVLLCLGGKNYLRLPGGANSLWASGMLLVIHLAKVNH